MDGFHWEYVDKEMKVVKNFNKNKNNQKEAVSKKVICIETGEIFNSAKEAGEKVGLYNGSAIIACCRGRFQTSKGLHWKYLDDYRSTTIENIQTIVEVSRVESNNDSKDNNGDTTI